MSEHSDENLLTDTMREYLSSQLLGTPALLVLGSTKRRFRLLMVSVLFVSGTLVSGMAYAYFAASPPLLLDEFEGLDLNREEWRVVLPELSEARWEELKAKNDKVVPPDVQVEGGRVMLLNRGYLVSRRQFPGGVSLRLRWLWAEPSDHGKGTPKERDDYEGAYNDHLTIVLRTSGTPRARWPHEVTDGILIKFTANKNQLSIYQPFDAKSLRDADLPMMKRGEWQDIVITDDGENIAVFFGTSRSLITEVKIPNESDSHHVAFYNRESVGGTDGAPNKKSFLEFVRFDAVN